MAVRPILILGDPLLWQPCQSVPERAFVESAAQEGDIQGRWIQGGGIRAGKTCGDKAGSPERQRLLALLVDLQDTLLRFRRNHGSAKAIAAPQIGSLFRVVFVSEPGPKRFLVNPVLTGTGSQRLRAPAMAEAWESCMSFPGLYVRTSRLAECSVNYRDAEGREHTESASGELSIVLQHECDHLDGILSLQRAVDEHSLFLGSPGRKPPQNDRIFVSRNIREGGDKTK